MAGMAIVVRRPNWLLCVAVLLVGVPVLGTAQESPFAPPCRDEPRCVELLEDGIDLIEAGRWEAASILLEAVVVGLEGHASHARDLARAYVYLGVARLQVTDANETRRLFAEARMRDPTLRLDPAEFPRDVLEIWDEARELGVLVVDTEPAGAPAREAPADVPTMAQRFSPDTTKKIGRSMWRTLVGVLAVAGGAVVIGARDCTLAGAGTLDEGTPVEVAGGIVQITGFTTWNRPGGGCRMRYGWRYDSASGNRQYGRVEDHELLKSGDRETLWIDPHFNGRAVSGSELSILEERLPDALMQSVGSVRTRRMPVSHLIGGLALVGAGALLATIWSDGGVVVEDVAVAVTPTGVLASRSFGW